MIRNSGSVWFRRTCFLSVLLISTSMGGLVQTALAASKGPAPNSVPGQILILQHQINALQDQLDSKDKDKDKDGPLLVLHTKTKEVVHTKGDEFIFSEGTDNLVPIDVVDGNPITQSRQFKTAGEFTVTYTAECAVSAVAGNYSTWVNIDIEVVNVETKEVVKLPPSDVTDDAFCTANGTAGFDGWAMHSITGVAKNMPRATYTVQIRANIQNGGGDGWLGDSSLVVRK